MGKKEQCSGDTSEASDDFKIARDESQPDVKAEKSCCLSLFVNNNICTITIVLLSILISILYISFDNSNGCLRKIAENIKDEEWNDYHAKKYLIYGSNAHHSHLEHFMLTLKRFGYAKKPLVDSWDLLWAQDDPFNDTKLDLKNIRHFQRVNHFPGYQDLYDKISIGRSGIRGVPATFKLPEQSQDLLAFTKEYSGKTFIYKYPNDTFTLRKADNLQDTLALTAIVQEFIANPLLYSNAKFDIGVFVAITSIDPLRVFIYNADVGIRKTPDKYSVDDPLNENSYITSEGSIVIDLDELTNEYAVLQATTKQSLINTFNTIVDDCEDLWNEMERIIREYIVGKEKYLIKQSREYTSTDNFFEIMRFNFMITSSWNVYLMSINPFPKIDSKLHFWDIELYDHILYNFFGLIGLAPKVHSSTLDLTEEMTRIQSDEFNLGVYPEECLSSTCKFCGNFDICKLCKKCLTRENKNLLLRAHSEQLNKGDCKRIYPPQIDRLNLALPTKFSTFSKRNRIMHLWYKGKCMLNSMWCG